ncbi:MAG TPA: hypothetical protein DIT90_06235, partial [Dehalococcoidia bacterium]|nr:hypothetical protein [Dehalococcoidia bacterium]
MVFNELELDPPWTAMTRARVLLGIRSPGSGVGVLVGMRETVLSPVLGVGRRPVEVSGVLSGVSTAVGVSPGTGV